VTAAGKGFYLTQLTMSAYYTLVVVGLCLLMGYAGQISMGHAGFFAIGAYTSAVLNTTDLSAMIHGAGGRLLVQIGGIMLSKDLYGTDIARINPWISFICALIVTTIIAYLIGMPVLRLKGHYLAVATLGFGLLVAIVLSNEAGWTGGPDGMSVPKLTLFGWSVRGADAWYWISGTTFVGGFILALNLMQSPTGRSLQAIHDSEIASLVLGIDVASKKLTIFIISAMYASVAGSYLALFNGHVTPDVAGFLRSIELVAMVVLGGMGSIVGSLVGAIVLVVLPQVLTVFHEYEQALLGLIVMVFMIFLRRGIVPSLAAILQGWRK